MNFLKIARTRNLPRNLETLETLLREYRGTMKFHKFEDLLKQFGVICRPGKKGEVKFFDPETHGIHTMSMSPHAELGPSNMRQILCGIRRNTPQQRPMATSR